MYRTLLYLSALVGFIKCSGIYESDNNLVKPRFERNKVNKGVWLRHKPAQDPFEKPNLGNFIFRANSLDTESIIQNAFDPFNSQQQDMMSTFMRNKRSPHSKNKHRLRKSLTNVNKSAVTPSVFHDYPYEVTVLLDSPNNKNIDYNVYPKYETKVPVEGKENETEEISINKLDIIKDNDKQETDNVVEYFKDVVNVTDGNVTTPKRSMDYGSEFRRVNLLEVLNKSRANHAMKVMKGSTYQIEPEPNFKNDVLTIEPKVEVKTSKPITERGLIKVLSMLTKTFKKIMKQHNDIKTIHSQMQNINDDFKDKIETHTKKLQDFDIKYNFFLKIIEKLKEFQEKLKSQEDNYKKKDEEMSKNLIKFESQQKKFLAQQQNFFNLQKLLLAQNEKINQKQNQIAKSQTEISQRQNGFARILEKAKKLYGNKKFPKLTTSIVKPKEIRENVTIIKKVTETLQTSTESIKIDLFSIPPNAPIANQDQLILKEKDDKSVDDLIYKYYFNNTFIDSVIKNKLLSGYFLTDKTSLARNAKHKRNKHEINKTVSEFDTTILLPVQSEPIALHRERRWINHHSKKRHRRKHHGKGSSNKLFHTKQESNTVKPTEKIAVKENNIATDPFLSMATSFCKEIGQNSTKQILDWCVEKALRRLKSLDTKLVQPVQPPPTVTKEEPPQVTISELSYIATLPPSTPEVTRAPAVLKSTAPVILTTEPKKNTPRSPKTAEFDVFFPDNEELESNLKQFELTKDTEGNVYYDGSLHESDIIGEKSKDVSDFLPEFDSNSRVDIDTNLMELRSKRQFYARRMTAMLMKRQEAAEKARRKAGSRYL